MIKCNLCNIERLDLTKHIIRIHKISTQDYLKQFPKSQLMSKELGMKRTSAYRAYNNSCHSSWNKGLTKETNERLKKIGESISKANTEEVKQKRINTNLEKYGVVNSRQSEHAKRKSIETCIKKYGVENPAQSVQFRGKYIEKRLLKNINCTMLEKYDYNASYGKFYKFKCNLCFQEFQYQLNRQTFPKCPHCYNKYKRIQEQELKLFIENLGVTINSNNRSILIREEPYPLEMDIYCPDYKIGIEYNGLKWHSSEFLEDNYYLEKLKLAEKAGVRLIQIFEDEWLYKRDIVKSRLKSIFKKLENKIPARKCKIKIISNEQERIFLEENHIQGFVGSSTKLGLFSNEILVAIMTFGRLRNSISGSGNDEEFELLRYCSLLNTTIIGGAQRLFSYFKKNYKIERIISYSDRRWNKGSLYESLGFKLKNTSNPNYFYVIDGERKNRLNYKKHTLIEKGYSKDKTEKEIMEEQGYYQIHDCGNLVYEYTSK